MQNGPLDIILVYADDSVYTIQPTVSKYEDEPLVRQLRGSWSQGGRKTFTSGSPTGNGGPTVGRGWLSVDSFKHEVHHCVRHNHDHIIETIYIAAHRGGDFKYDAATDEIVWQSSPFN